MKKQFDFGKNWNDFSLQVTPSDYIAAKKSLQKLVPDLKNKTFLDIGCGSGLFAASASSLGAKKVVAIDVNHKCITVSKLVLSKVSIWDRKINKKTVKFKVESILNRKNTLGKYDIVYSWGVLHHTGKMYASFNNTKKLVKKNGLLVIAIYNKHFTSSIWKQIKYFYMKSPLIIKKALIWVIFIIRLLGNLIINQKNPLKQDRGMNFYFDIVDWAGGYPYEYASVDEVKRYFEKNGFKTINVIKTSGFTGCNQFIFKRCQKCVE